MSLKGNKRFKNNSVESKLELKKIKQLKLKETIKNLRGCKNNN